MFVFHKTLEDTMAITRSLFEPGQLPPLSRYDKLFDNLPLLPEEHNRTGRPAVARNAILRASVYRCIRRLPTLSDLVFELNNNPTMLEVVGLDALKPAPSVERFSSFLRDTPNAELQKIRKALVSLLLQEQVLSGRLIALDSCPIVMPVKENNLKTSVRNRFDKTQYPKADPQCRLGVLVHYPNPFQKKVRYFWGYRNHIITDTETELPMWEFTQPANVSEVKIAIPLLRACQEAFGLTMEAVMGDAEYDVESILAYIIDELKAEAIIPRRTGKNPDKGYTVKGDCIICTAGLPMHRKGKMRPKKTGILYCQYSCPLYYDKKVRYQYIVCPAVHPKFFEQKGCNVLIRLEPSVRTKIDYDTEKFKDLYNTRTSVERVFSRLLSIAMQNPTVKGLNAVSNHCTIAHITVLLVALTAHRSGQKDKIRFVKSFVPNFLHTLPKKGVL